MSTYLRAEVEDEDGIKLIVDLSHSYVSCSAESRIRRSMSGDNPKRIQDLDEEKSAKYTNEAGAVECKGGKPSLCKSNFQI